ncbi:transposase, partial [Deinococcus misasensis]
ELGKQGKKALLLVWDNASWHISKQVIFWIKQYNREAKASGGVRILSGLLPKRSPWLNPIEPKWLHGKRAVIPAQGLLSAKELESRVCAYYACPKLEPLAQPLS